MGGHDSTEGTRQGIATLKDEQAIPLQELFARRLRAPNRVARLP